MSDEFIPEEDILETFELDDTPAAEEEEDAQETNEDEDNDIECETHPGAPPKALFTAHLPDEVYSVLSASSSLFASGGSSDSLLFWRLTINGPEIIHEHAGSESVACLAGVRGGVACGWVDGRVTAYRGPDYGNEQVVVEGLGEIRFLVSHGDLLCAGTEDGAVWTWRVSDDVENLSVFPGYGAAVSCGFFVSSDAIVVGDVSGNLLLLDINGNVRKKANVHEEVVSLCAGAGNSVAVGTASGAVLLVSLGTLAVQSKKNLHTDAVTCIAYCTDLRAFVCAAMDGLVNIVQADLTIVRHSINLSAQHQEPKDQVTAGVTNMVLCKGQAVVGTENGVLVCIDIRTGNVVNTLQSPATPVMDLSMHGNTLVVGSANGLVSVFDV